MTDNCRYGSMYMGQEYYWFQKLENTDCWPQAAQLWSKMRTSRRHRQMWIQWVHADPSLWSHSYSLLNLGRRRWTMAAWIDERQRAIWSCASSNHECIRCHKQTRWIRIFNEHRWCLTTDSLQRALWVTLLHKYTLWSRCRVLPSTPVLVNSRVGLINGLLHCLRSCVTISRLRDTHLLLQSYFFTSDTGALCYCFIVLCRFSLVINSITDINAY